MQTKIEEEEGTRKPQRWICAYRFCKRRVPVREGENKETEAAATDSSKNTDTCA